MTIKYTTETTAIVFKLSAVGNNKLTQRKELHYC